MCKIIKLTLSYIRFYKRQTITMLIGIILSGILISGIGSLIYSGRIVDYEQTKKEFGDWHYQITATDDLINQLSSQTTNKDFRIENYCILKVKKIVSEPSQLTFCSAEQDYMNMMGRTLIEGKLPTHANEIAVDYHTINNLSISDRLGDTVTICNKPYRLCGIITEGPKDNSSGITIFIGDTTVMKDEFPLVYVKFDEKHNVNDQIDAFVKAYYIQNQDVRRNNDVTIYVAESSRVNMNHSLLTDECLDCDIDVHIDSTNGNYSITKQMLDQIKEIHGIDTIDEMSYLLGEFPMQEDTLQW